VTYSAAMRVRELRSAACSALVAVTLGIASPAHAGDLSNVDPAKDVRYYDLAEGVEASLPGTVMPERRLGDLKRFTVRYGEKRIRVVLKFRELTRAEPVLMIQSRFQFPSPEGGLNYAEGIITATEANWAGKARMTTTDCDVKHRLSYLNNRARLSFPARCFSSPRWIRFNAWVLTMDHKTDPTYFYGDHVFPVISSTDSALERYTRRIRRP
jgi:hypothetical protein